MLDVSSSMSGFCFFSIVLGFFFVTVSEISHSTTQRRLMLNSDRTVISVRFAFQSVRCLFDFFLNYYESL